MTHNVLVYVTLMYSFKCPIQQKPKVKRKYVLSSLVKVDQQKKQAYKEAFVEVKGRESSLCPGACEFKAVPTVLVPGTQRNFKPACASQF